MTHFNNSIYKGKEDMIIFMMRSVEDIALRSKSNKDCEIFELLIHGSVWSLQQPITYKGKPDNWTTWEGWNKFKDSNHDLLNNKKCNSRKVPKSCTMRMFTPLTNQDKCWLESTSMALGLMSTINSLKGLGKSKTISIKPTTSLSKKTTGSFLAKLFKRTNKKKSQTTVL
jgi:hypothetical protein